MMSYIDGAGGSPLFIKLENIKKRLDHYYQVVKKVLLPYQSVSTGLFSCDNVAYVRDNIYCAAAVWSLYLAYQRLDDDSGRTYELEYATVKCMRGILYCYMRQVDHVEKFKASQSPEDAFHCCYDAATGGVVKGQDENHLQLDIVALFMLYTIQMVDSGLQIIFDTNEVAFMQNLIFYLERSYRTSDYGVWGRGSKFNNGSSELHGSSIGPAKAVLESVNGFNLFGKHKGAPWSTLWVDMDAHNRNRTCLDYLLPRESKSKSVDAAQLPMISYPFFAVDHEGLRQTTLKMILEQLEGVHGLKRFRGDGYQTVVEDKSRKLYEPAELKYFLGIECEWSIFFIYLIIDGIITGDSEQADKYHTKLQPLLVDKDDCKLVPRFYFVTEDNIDAERVKPGSTSRKCSFELPYEKPVFLWGQALLVISDLLREKLILPKDLDPVRRFIPIPERQKVSMRYYTIDSFVGDTVVQVTPIVESQQIVEILSAYGFSAQTVKDVSPIEIWSSQELQALYSQLGKHQGLGLSGRPSRPIGALGTSKVYRIQGKSIVCFPLEFDTDDFYLAYDIHMLIKNLLHSLQFVARYWRMPQRPLFIFLIHSGMLEGDRMEPILNVLSHLKRGEWSGVKVKMGRIQNFLSSSIVETVDCAYPKEHEFSTVLKSMQKSTDVQMASLKDISMHESSNHSFFHLELEDMNHTVEISAALELIKLSLDDMQSRLFDFKSGYALTIILEEIASRQGPHFNVGQATCYDLLNCINQWAGRKKLWSLVRYTAGLCRKVVNSLAPSISAILIRDKYLSLGIFGHKEQTITNPLPPNELTNLLYDMCSEYDPRDSCLQQELILHLGRAINEHPHYFDNILQIRVGWLAFAMRRYMDKDISTDVHGGFNSEEEKHIFMRDFAGIAGLSPSKLNQLLNNVFSVDSNTPMCCLKKKQIFGALNRSPSNFYSKMWLVLERSPAGIAINNHLLPQQPYLSDMSKGEVMWGMKVEELFLVRKEPEYQYLIKETLSILATLLDRNKELYFKNVVGVNKIADGAIWLYANNHGDNLSQSTKGLSKVERFCMQPNHDTFTYITRSIVLAFLEDGINILPMNECSTS